MTPSLAWGGCQVGHINKGCVREVSNWSSNIFNEQDCGWGREAWVTGLSYRPAAMGIPASTQLPASMQQSGAFAKCSWPVVLVVDLGLSRVEALCYLFCMPAGICFWLWDRMPSNLVFQVNTSVLGRRVGGGCRDGGWRNIYIVSRMLMWLWLLGSKELGQWQTQFQLPPCSPFHHQAHMQWCHLVDGASKRLCLGLVE